MCFLSCHIMSGIFTQPLYSSACAAILHSTELNSTQLKWPVELSWVCRYEHGFTDRPAAAGTVRGFLCCQHWTDVAVSDVFKYTYPVMTHSTHPVQPPRVLRGSTATGSGRSMWPAPGTSCRHRLPVVAAEMTCVSVHAYWHALDLCSWWYFVYVIDFMIAKVTQFLKHSNLAAWSKGFIAKNVPQPHCPSQRIYVMQHTTVR